MRLRSVRCERRSGGRSNWGASMREGRARRVVRVSSPDVGRCPIRPRSEGDGRRASERSRRPLSSSDSPRLRERLRVSESEDPSRVRLPERVSVDRSRDAYRPDRGDRSERVRDERPARSRSLLRRPTRVDDRERSVRVERRVRVERSASVERPIRPLRARVPSALPVDERETLRSAAWRSLRADPRPIVEPRGRRVRSDVRRVTSP
jgi:hypothetical protein